ncbi:tripartite tricarboxylate transporter substrate binding protein [Siccirubricoccus sp. KC 17139]|uniref:Tripartite tricarboxylate transporter substrate binding protein n=1 Tax=Siccirubricoccus soli TaxID=2899147 RepID=A0ABT1DDG6_9PROT|nr:tripartite tricarboxylate transporter substrate binding protein [Siccirubricoccus soli]MCO6419976.1 tripartite tricarboxylate transporter substrate binding protein [Siccirubricoccus soli]MCP2686111.1 tripartite tricarboxylate transporter substrate binding protein [Siccirubricoccus soli]
MFTRRAALALLALPALARTARAEGWRPTQPVRIIVPAAPGGTADISARLVAPYLQAQLGQNVVVENRSGAGGVIGTQEAVRATPDGHTLLLGNIGPQAIGLSLYRNLPYNRDSLIPVGGTVRGPNVLVVHPSIPANTLPELVAHLKKNPGKLSFGSPGVGQSPHLTGVWFNQATGTEAIHVPFRGAGPAAMELVAGNIQFMWDNLTSGIQQIKAGRVRALAVSSADRNPQLPDVPAARETMPELAQFDVNTWFGIFAPAHTPRPVVETIARHMAAWQETAEVQARWREMGGVALRGTPEEFTAFVNGEIDKWSNVIRREGLQLDVG